MSESELRLKQARFRLILDHPFLASAAACFPLKLLAYSSWCRTMATDGYFVYANADWVADQSDEDLVFVLAHEVLHCLLGHIERRANREPQRWNYAIDFATNSLLVASGLPLPKSALFQESLSGKPAEEVYELLEDHKYEAHCEPFDRHLEPNEMPAVGEGLAAMEPPQASSAAGSTEEQSQTVELSGSVLDETAGSRPSPEELQRLRKVLLIETQKRWSSLKLPGRFGGLWKDEIEAASTTQVSWRELMSRFVTGLRRTDYRMYPFNKKHLWRGFYIPSVGVPGPDHLVVAIDTSGSMSEEDHAMLLGEIDALRDATGSRLTLIQADATIQKIDEFGPEGECVFELPKTMFGRGGTSFIPVFDWVDLQLKNGISIDALIYMTDGYGPAPSSPPPIPVLWILSPKGVEPAAWGEKIRLTGHLL